MYIVANSLLFMERKDEQEAKELYNKQCSEFSKKQTKYKENKHIRKMIKTNLGETKNKKILFAGCGEGSECYDYKKAKTFGIDIRDKCIEIAMKNYPRTTFKISDMESTTFRNNSFNIIISIFSLMYKRNIIPVLKEFNRILDDNGEVVFAVPHPLRKMVKYNEMNYFVKGKHYEYWKGIKRFNYYRLFEDYIHSINKARFYLFRLFELKPVSDSTYPHHAIFMLKKLNEEND